MDIAYFIIFAQNPIMLVTIVAATPFEVDPIVEYLKREFEEKEAHLYRKNHLLLRVLITGVGIPLTALQLGLYLAKEQPDLLINAGIAGAINKKLALGAVVNVASDAFGDLGVEEADGRFTDIHQLGLINPDEAPFESGRLYNEGINDFSFLEKVSGVTVNKVHGYAPSITSFIKKYPCDIETMESAAVFLACLQTGTNFLALRSISNYVESRNRENWEIALAIKNLNEVLKEILDLLQKE